MFEKVNPSHPDKIADRIAGALVDLAYKQAENPKIAVEVLIGHKECRIITETSVALDLQDVTDAVHRIAGEVNVVYQEVPQDTHLADNQRGKIRCGDNGIFKGVPLTTEEKALTKFAKNLYKRFRSDGKYIISGNEVIICQSNAAEKELMSYVSKAFGANTEFHINPLGDWIGGTDVDTGATNRKLGSDMGGSITGGGLHGKDLSKADVSINIFAFALAQLTGETIEFDCAIGDEMVAGIPYESIVGFARGYIDTIGGFEKFAEWGLIC